MNTVVDVLINFQELGDWPRALEIALPQRKRSKVGRQAVRRRQKMQQLQSSNGEDEASGESGAALAQSQTAKQNLQEELPSIENLSLWLGEMQPEEESDEPEDSEEELSPKSGDESVVL